MLIIYDLLTTIGQGPMHQMNSMEHFGK